MQADLSHLLNIPAEVAAPRLLGCELVREFEEKKLVAKIVETEAYDQTDEASHSFRGNTERTSVMFGPAGFLYVYFTYGMHYCMNVVIDTPGHGAAVLIRAIEPLASVEIMSANRHGLAGPILTNGPAKLTQALAIDKNFNGHNLAESPLKLVIKPPLATSEIVQTTRVGISRATGKPWRFYIRDNIFVSKPNLA